MVSALAFGSSRARNPSTGPRMGRHPVLQGMGDLTPVVSAKPGPWNSRGLQMGLKPVLPKQTQSPLARLIHRRRACQPGADEGGQVLFVLHYFRVLLLGLPDFLVGLLHGAAIALRCLGCGRSWLLRAKRQACGQRRPEKKRSRHTSELLQ